MLQKMKHATPILAVLTLTLFGVLSCTPSIDCTDVGCPFGQTCSTETGACATIIRDCRVQDVCRSGEVCDESTGECRSEALQCADGNPCPNGLICNGQTGFCVPRFRCTIDGCPSSEVCDTRTDECVPRPCASDRECPDSFVCDGSVCISGCRPGLASCPTGQSCLVQTGEMIGICQDRCRQDTDCPFGQICTEDVEGTSCRLEPPCTEDSECRIDEVCRQGTCNQPPCATDEDCLTNQICNSQTGECTTDSCEEDVYGERADRAPNHSFDTAFPLAPGDDCPAAEPNRCLYSDLVVCAGRSDWFSVNVGSSNLIRIRIDTASMDPDLDLYVYDSESRLIALDQQAGPTTNLRFAAPRNDTLFIEIRPTRFAETTYSLSISNEFCQDDAFEENDGRNTATILPRSEGVEAQISLRSCGFDEDWLTIQDARADNGFRLEILPGAPQLTAQVYLPDTSTHALDRNREILIPRIGTAGDIFARIRPQLGQSGEYRIRYELAPPWTCPNSRRPASDPTETAPLPEGAVHESTLCLEESLWEPAWYELEVSQPGILAAEIVPGPHAPPVSVALLSDAGSNGAPTLVRTATHIDGAYRIAATVDASRRYWVRVNPIQSPSRLDGEPTLDLFYSIDL